MLTLFRKLAVLDRLYEIHDRFTASLPLACRKFCADCCTCNVTLTSLEARKIVMALDLDARQKYLKVLTGRLARPRFVPQFTTNQLAEICLADEDPPAEEIDPAWGPCPLLFENACPIYDVRPFACRCMVSTRPCRDCGEAEMDDFTLTVNHVFLQYIEHIDQNGVSGNFSDLLVHLLRQESPQPDAPAVPLPGVLIPNAPLKALLIPPEHREKIAPILAAIRAIQA